MTPQSETKTIRALWYMFFPGGGIGRYTHEVAQELHRLPDIDLELACLQEFHFLNKAEYPVWPKLLRIASDRPLVRRTRFLCGQLMSPQRAIRHAAATGADVLHLSNINHLTYPLWRRLLRRHPSIRLAATVHDVRRSKAMLHRGWEEQALRRFYEDADALFVHSHQQRDDLQDFAQVSDSRIHQVPMGTMPYAAPTASQHELRQRLGLPESRPVGLFFGNIRDDKNLDGLLDAMAKMSDPFFLVVAGRAGGADNRDMEWYRSRADTLGLSGSILFLDRFIEDGEVGDLFEAADFVPLCYLTSFTSQSAVLNVAVHYRKPVLVSPAPTLAETTRQFEIGVITESDDADSLATGTEKLLARLQAGGEFSFESYQRSNSWQENARLTRCVYHQIVNS